VALHLRDQLLARGLERQQISAKGYWSLGRPIASWGELDDREQADSGRPDGSR
jgi:hypothetical protein